MPLPLLVKAPAKINLFLNVLGQRPDGFHEICSVMQTLTLADELTIQVLGEGLLIELTCSEATLSSSDNLLVKAYQLFYQQTKLPPFKLNVHLEKFIPVAAGLGGGSADAAAMLLALNELHQHQVPLESLLAIAARLGSDVPFFLQGSTALVSGRGEKVTSLAPLPACEVVLVKPKALGISAASAYQALREEEHYQKIDFTAWETFLKHPYPQGFTALLYNDFERVLYPKYPQLAWAKETLLQHGCFAALLSGSGPTVFGLIENSQQQWPKLLQAFGQEEWWLSLTAF